LGNEIMDLKLKEVKKCEEKTKKHGKKAWEKKMMRWIGAVLLNGMLTSFQ